MSSARYFDLSIPAAHRLAMMREDFATHSARYPHCPESVKPATWRDVRGTTHKGCADYFGLASHGWNPGPCNTRVSVLTSFDAASLPVRSVKFADDVARAIGSRMIDHQGWFADSEGCGDRGVIRGIVAALPHGRFIAGYHWSDNGEYVLFLNDVYSGEDAARECARAADGHAESYAETCRDDDAKYCAMQDAESDTEEKAEALRDAWALRRQGRRDSDDVREAIEELREARETLKTATMEYEGA